jgi:site-specific recombinase XerD
MDIQRAIKDFIEVRQLDKCSVYTIRDYQRVLANFAEWLETQGVTDTDQLELSHLRAWMSKIQGTISQRGKPYSDSTVQQFGLHMISFCHWLEHEGTIEKPITTRFKLPRVEKKMLITFTPEEVNRLLAACEDGTYYKPGLQKALTARNRAIVSVLIDTGIRRKELAGLRLCDIDPTLRLLIVHRKGNKWQQVPISREGFRPLHEYITKHRPHLAKMAGDTVRHREDPVFLTDGGKPMNIYAISALFVRLKKRTGIQGKQVSPHNCRRYMATTQLAAGRSPLDVQRQMGHTSLHMTNRYASLTTEQLQRSHEAYSPLRIKQVGGAKEESNGYWDE